jgi:XTP/dITP diphosphohydrolase
MIYAGIDVAKDKHDCIIVDSNGKKIVARGECEGHILYQERGSNGFGYDPLFVPVGYDKTFAELSAEEKNKISHRAIALQNLRKLLAEERKPKKRD